jgi:RNA polymerase sigma-70 factor, ECF subfamily
VNLSTPRLSLHFPRDDELAEPKAAGVCLSTSSRPRVQPRGSRFTLSRAYFPALKGGASRGRTGKEILTEITRITDESRSSEDLMARIAEGDDHAFEILVNRHQTSVLNLIYRFIGDRTQAKDLAQEVFLRVWQSAKSYEPKAKFTTWIYRITVNLCFNELKSSRRRNWFQFLRFGEDQEKTAEDAVIDPSPSPEDLLIDREQSQQIKEALHGLPENQRMALILKRYDDLSYEEIARILGCSVSAVESLLVRAKRTLQEKLNLI